MFFKLNLKTAIVTGAGRGIGRETALTLARLGADVLINDLDEAAALATAKEVSSLGRKSSVFMGDVSLSGVADKIVAQAQADLGRLDILVNNAGITRDAMLNKMTEDQWDAVMRVNLKGPYLMTQACARVMSAQKTGRIVNLASVAWLGNVGQTNYSASKAGVVGMTRTWAIELARYGITVNAIAPGFIDTPMTQAVPEAIKEKFVQRIPLKRMGLPQDIASMIAFFCSDEAGYITGQTIQVDGGLTTGINPG